jgi:ssDNA-binding replication factor A large subunit
MTTDDMMESLEKQTGVPKKVLSEMVIKKQNSTEGVSFEGAVRMVAHDFGINSFEDNRQMHITEIISGMKNVNIAGRIFNISRIVDFKRNDTSSGRVVNVHIGDFSGFTKLALWNDQVKLVEEVSIKVGDVIQISNAFAKENQFGDIELSLGKFGNIKIIEADMPAVDFFKKRIVSKPQYTAICNIGEGFFEIKGEVVSIFHGNFTFNICSMCSSSLVDGKCPEHSDVEPSQATIISLLIDDGTGDIRVVFFREVAEKISGLTAKELSAMNREERYETVSKDLIGKSLVVSGRVKMNNIYDRLEMIARDFENLDILQESRRLLSVVEAKLNTTTNEGGNNI